VNPVRLALRTVLAGRARTWPAIVIVAAAVCALGLAAGRIASEAARQQYHAVVKERMGHGGILPAAPDAVFTVEEAERIRLAALDRQHVPARVHSWQELSSADAQAWTLRCIAAIVLVVVAAVVAATASLQVLARRRELATLRALGMKPSGLVLLLELEALWITSIGMLLGICSGSVAAWVANRAAIAWQGWPEEGVPPLLDPGAGRMLLALAALLGTGVLAALVPALRAARHDVAHGLALLPPHQEC
jgi:hypothetical protein